MSSTADEIRQAIIDAINEDKSLLAELASIPGKIEKTVEQFTPVLTGETVRSISVKSRRSELKKLSTRRVKLGEVYSDDDPERVGAIEYGRSDGEHGETEGAYMFQKAAAYWNELDLSWR